MCPNLHFQSSENLSLPTFIQSGEGLSICVVGVVQRAGVCVHGQRMAFEAQFPSAPSAWASPQKQAAGADVTLETHQSPNITVLISPVANWFEL